MKKADLVIFISWFALNVIEKKLGKRIKNKIVIPHGLNENFKNSSDIKNSYPKMIPNCDYLLYVSTNFDVYRNQMEVVQGFHIFKKKSKTKDKLVLVGNTDTLYGTMVVKEVNRLGLQNDVIFPGFILFENLPEVYFHAKLILFASESENCPIILLESMGAGRPIISSNRQPMLEFAGDAVIYYDPSSPQDLADKLNSLNDDPDLMQVLSEKAITRSFKYDWRQTGYLTWRAIKNLCGS